MTVITRKRTDKFAIIPNAVAEDERISFEARGILCYLLAKPNDWKVQIADLQRSGKIGRDKAYKIIKELKEAGYLKHVAIRDDKARITSYEYEVYDTAVPEQFDLGDAPKLSTADLLPEKPEPEKLLPEKLHTALPDTANQDALIRTEEYQEPIPPKSPEAQPVASWEGDFNILWEGCPVNERPDNRHVAATRMRLLSAEERSLAVKHYGAYRKMKIRRGEKPVMIPYLREKLFLQFEDGPELDEDGLFVITPDRPEWRPWMGDIRARFGDSGVASIVRQLEPVYRAKSRWPQARAEVAA